MLDAKDERIVEEATNVVDLLTTFVIARIRHPVGGPEHQAAKDDLKHGIRELVQRLEEAD